MSPVSRAYKTGSIIYFEGDKSESVFVLQSGSVQLQSISPDGSGELRETIKSGEFFGVKSALGRFPREETATVLADCNTMVMPAQEFEQLVLKNHKLVMKMLQIFSNQLRRLGRAVQTRMGETAFTPDGSGLFNIGEYYLENKKFSQAVYAYQKYVQFYPNGEYVAVCSERIEMAKNKKPIPQRSATVPQPLMAPAAPPETEAAPEVEEGLGNESGIGVAKKYFQAFALYSSGKFAEACREYKAILEKPSASGGEYIEKSYLDYGRCLISMHKPQEAIPQLTTMVTNFPKSPNIKQALFFIGKCYASLNNYDKAKAFFTKVQMMPPHESINKRAQKEIEDLGGGA
ncbi:MAG: cyclic nucleotide-binding domain-containing protein [Spirochaetota bacterium]|jgi:CRP-like cAMP-binding protein|nr:cyclic nucleotide-binding domain-containing protein [Spirochaetota bacterium]